MYDPSVGLDALTGWSAFWGFQDFVHWTISMYLTNNHPGLPPLWKCPECDRHSLFFFDQGNNNSYNKLKIEGPLNFDSYIFKTVVLDSLAITAWDFFMCTDWILQFFQACLLSLVCRAVTKWCIWKGLIFNCTPLFVLITLQHSVWRYRVVPGDRNHCFWPSQRVSKHTLMKSETQPASVVSINH